MTNVANTDLAISVKGGKYNDFADVVTERINSQSWQKVYFVATATTNEFSIVNQHTMKCIRPSDYGFFDWQYTCSGPNDTWILQRYVEPPLDKKVRILSRHQNSNCLQYVADNDNIAHGACQENNKNFWRLELTADSFIIKSEQILDQIVDIQAIDNQVDGLNVRTYKRLNGTNQKWIIESIENEYFRIRNIRTDRCVQANDDGSVTQATCVRSTRQQFSIIDPTAVRYSFKGILKQARTAVLIPSVELSNNLLTVTLTNRTTGSITNATIDYNTSSFSVSVIQGEYLLSITMNGYITLEEYVTFNANLPNKEYFLSKVMRGLIAVLTWGVQPSDLDLWCDELSTGKKTGWNSKSNSPVFLDLDDVSSYGPETMTIMETNSRGRYNLWVNNYSNQVPLTQSQASVIIYVGDTLVARVNVPTTGTGRNWNIATYDSTTGNVVVNNSLY